MTEQELSRLRYLREKKFFGDLVYCEEQELAELESEARDEFVVKALSDFRSRLKEISNE